MSVALARAAYSALLRLGTPLYFARLWWRGRREPLYRTAWNERLGGFDGAAQPGRLWLHAVSLGETLAAVPLIEALRAQRPHLRILLTHGTATGRAAGARLLHKGDAQAWLPYDTPGAVRRFLRAHQPSAGVLMETEVWPNLLFEAQAAGVPLVLANARLSERSRAKGERVAALMHPALAVFDKVLAQTEPDAQRLRASGARNVRVLGNLKFDVSPPPDLVARGRRWRAALGRHVVLAASTREGEEAPLLRAWRAQRGPRPLLLLVPRHPQRFDEVGQAIAQAGLAGLRRSAWGDPPPPEAAQADVWLGDSMGEMALYAAMADTALLGGSFARLGGQNLIELMACGCPVVMGPHTYNFAKASDLALAAGAAQRAADIAEGVARAVDLACGGGLVQASKHALAFAAEHRGAAVRMAREIVALLPSKPKRH